MPAKIMGGGVPLGAPAQFTIQSSRLARACAMAVHRSGLDLPGMDVHLQVINIPSGEEWLIPMPRRNARQLATDLLRALSDDPLLEAEEGAQL